MEKNNDVRYLELAQELIRLGIAKVIDPYDNQYSLYEKYIEFNEDLPLYKNYVQKVKGAILDVACGNGRIMKSLLEQDLQVHGIDISKSMIKELNQEIETNHWNAKAEVADMRDFVNFSFYELCIIGYGAITYLKNLDECEKVFHNMYQSLKKGGYLIFDFEIGKGKEEKEGPFISNSITFPQTNESLLRLVELQGKDEFTRICNVIDFYLQGKNLEILIEVSEERKYIYKDIMELLIKTGFHIIDTLRDYSGEKFNASTMQNGECIVIAQK